MMHRRTKGLFLSATTSDLNGEGSGLETTNLCRSRSPAAEINKAAAARMP